ncbi:hypothetical protein DFH08DRAFT_799818 [Mycena albidolilacea]|uniref:Uncharacterized protein n=1 Tax=Mycena albidolilacea TaxID=1033008 RepID=A0AAD7AMJ7_9AGAR|nr:hypothetical protein DFH08DRAFT_799818 [Mycena albidolilacea]
MRGRTRERGNKEGEVENGRDGATAMPALERALARLSPAHHSASHKCHSTIRAHTTYLALRGQPSNLATNRDRNSRIARVTGGIYETLKQVTEMLEKGSKNGIFASAHVQLASNATAFAPTINFNVLTLDRHPVLFWLDF